MKWKLEMDVEHEKINIKDGDQKYRLEVGGRNQ